MGFLPVNVGRFDSKAAAVFGIFLVFGFEHFGLGNMGGCVGGVKLWYYLRDYFGTGRTGVGPILGLWCISTVSVGVGTLQ